MPARSRFLWAALFAVAFVFFAWNVKLGKVKFGSPLAKTSIPKVPVAVSASRGTLPSVVQVSSAHELSPQDRVLFKTYEEIKSSKNDNDPRIDQDFKNMSQELHQALIDDYNNTAPEKRNERGLVVFMIARDAGSPEDLQFLNSVYKEEPCASLENCAVPHQVDPHLGGIEDTSLNYPQLAGLFQLENRLATEGGSSLLKDPKNVAQIQKIIGDAEAFPSSAVQARAQGLRQKLGL